ncbi:MAG: hypothetical protein GKR89_22455 [Candidatus Latescibacteria bacterium]|nr:hypothetical protein [Candidatus Latescibacterota bacterium]
MEGGSQREQVIVAAVMGAAANVNWMTNDRVEALTGGHGMLNMPVIAIANEVSREIFQGRSVEVKFANERTQPIDDMLAKAIAAGQAAGAAPVNAALLSATMVYLAGAQPQVGIPAGNRKLGATARMIAGVDRSGVAAVPTAKMNNKVSAFAAVMAVHQALIDGEISPVSGWDVPVGGPLYGHSALGEDIVFPQMAEKGAQIGTRAMLDCMAGAGIHPHPFTAALFGAAAILEIIHPDADVADEYGPYGKVTSAFVAGQAAARTAGLPETVHVRISRRAIPTAQLVGDLALIIKDIGGPTVIGIMAFDEMLSVFEEDLAGSSGGPGNSPLGHVGMDAVLALLLMLEEDADADQVAAALAQRRLEGDFDPETALVSLSIVARKAMEVRNGPITDILLKATEPVRAQALYRRAARACDRLMDGASLEAVVEEFDEERQRRVEMAVSRYFSAVQGREIDIRLTLLEAGARRKSKMAGRWLAFDPLISAVVTIDGETTELDHLVDRVIPAVARGEQQELRQLVELIEPVASELLLAGNVILNITVPVAVAAALGLVDPVEAGRRAEAAAAVSAGIPGARLRAAEAGRMAAAIMGL